MRALDRLAVADAPNYAAHRLGAGSGFARLALILTATGRRSRWSSPMTRAVVAKGGLRVLVLCGTLVFSGEAMSQRADILHCQEFANQIPTLIEDGCWLVAEEHKATCEDAYRQSTSKILSWCNGNVQRCDEQRRTVLERDGSAYPFNVTWGLRGWDPRLGGPAWSTKCFYAAVYKKAGTASPESQQSGQPSQSTVRRAQAELARLGYKPGPADGIAGRRTTAAVKRFQSDSGLPVDGRLSPALVTQLRAAVDAGKPKAEAQPTKKTPAAARSGKSGDLWGSIAFSQDAGGGYTWAMVWNSSGHEQAKQLAMEKCRGRGGENCQDVGWFKNQCAALAVGDGNGFAGGGGRTTAKAESTALSKCRTVDNNCQIVVSRCTDTATEASGVAKAPEKKEPVVATEPKCRDIADLAEGVNGVALQCWGEFPNKPGCAAFGFIDTRSNPSIEELAGIEFNSVVFGEGVHRDFSWSGRCKNGVAVGEGTISWARTSWSGGRGCGPYDVTRWEEWTGVMEQGKISGVWRRSFRTCDECVNCDYERESMEEARRNPRCVKFDDTGPILNGSVHYRSAPC